MGYGSDFSAVDDLDAGLSFLEGDDNELLALAQAQARRFITPRGGNPFDSAYGLLIAAYVSDTENPSQAAIAMQGEGLKDERIADCKVDITVVGGPGGDTSWNVVINSTAQNGDQFTLTLSVSSVTVDLLNISLGNQ